MARKNKTSLQRYTFPLTGILHSRRWLGGVIPRHHIVCEVSFRFSQTTVHSGLRGDGLEVGGIPRIHEVIGDVILRLAKYWSVIHNTMENTGRVEGAIYPVISYSDIP